MKVSRRVESVINVMKCKVRTLANLQKEGLQTISPTYPTNPVIERILYSASSCMSTFVGGFLCKLRV